MVGLGRVEAELFERRVASGRNRPIIVAGRDSAGALISCVVKLQARMENGSMHPLACICEWVAAGVADVLGINVPTPYEVVLTGEFAESVADQEIRRQLGASLGSTFGSGFLDPSGDRGATYTQNISPLHPDLRQPAADLLAFDVYVHNPDRRPDNANLFLRRSDIVALDHGDAFSFLWAIGGDAVRDPLLDMVARHVFGPTIRAWGGQDFSGFRARLSQLSDRQIAEIVSQCPAAWLNNSGAERLATIQEVLTKRRDAVEVWLPQVEAWLRSH